MLFIIVEEFLFIIFTFLPRCQQKRGIGERVKKKCDVCATGANFLSFFCVAPMIFCLEILAWASPEPMGGGIGGGVVSQQQFSRQQPFSSLEAGPPGVVKKGPGCHDKKIMWSALGAEILGSLAPKWE